MNKYTKEILIDLINSQNTFWQKIILYVVSWLLDQGFSITYNKF